MLDKYVIGLDFGSDSVRAVLINSANGETLASHVHWYQRWKQGKYCDPTINQFRQHPLDHIEGLEATITQVVQESGINPNQVLGICIDTTGSSPIPVDAEGTPLSLLEEFESNPNAMMILWKDHTAIAEAEEITQLARTWGGVDYTKYEGGIYSSEWFWAKILHIYRNDETIKLAAHSWIEHCDYMTFLLVDEPLDTFKRSRCAAGHKAMWHEEWGGLPSDEYLEQLDPALVTLKSNLYSHTFTSDLPAGTLNKEWAGRLGLSEDTVIAVGTFDAHAGAVGAEVQENTLVRVMGTSTCDIIISSPEVVAQNTVRGICGQVDGSVVPGTIGLEAGQSAFGDVLAWFKDLIAWPIEHASKERLNPEIQREIISRILPELTKAAEKLPMSESVPVALDWINGRRTPDADQSLKAAIMNLNLGTDAPKIFRALVEAICFGSKKIVDRFEMEGVDIEQIIGIGGVAKKSPFIMQTLANILNRPIKIANSEQAPALGAAMYAAVASGIYANVQTAIQKMGNGFETTYFPESEKVEFYAKLYAEYEHLGDFVEKQTHADKPEVSGSPFQAIKETCYEANMKLPDLDLVVYTFGNVSVVDREHAVFAIKPSGVPYETLQVEDIVIVDFNNNIVEGTMRPSSDTKTHALLYKTWSNIGSIVHTHSTYAVAWAQAQMDIPIFGTTHADHLTTDIPCTPPMADALIEGDYEHMTGQQIINHFAENELTPDEVEMVLIGNHGPFAWGKNADKAVYNSKVLEELARMAYLTRQINPQAPRLKDALIKKHYERKHGKNAYYGQ